MNQSRLSFGEILSAAGGVLLMASTFLPWFQRAVLVGVTGRSDGSEESLSAWQALGIFAVLIILIAAVPIWLALRRARGDVPARPQIHVAAGALAVTLVLGGAAFKLGNETIADAIERIRSTGAAGGLIVAALSALLIAVGGVWAMWGQRPVGRTSPGR